MSLQLEASRRESGFAEDALVVVFVGGDDVVGADFFLGVDAAAKWAKPPASTPRKNSAPTTSSPPTKTTTSASSANPDSRRDASSCRLMFPARYFANLKILEKKLLPIGI